MTVTPRELAGVRAVVTAGGPEEPIDPVRFIGNRSSGKQGHAVASELRRRSAHVTLISTSTDTLEAPAGIRRGSGRPRRRRWSTPSWTSTADADVVVMAAAVADFRPKVAADHKLKKADGAPDIVLEPTVDILATLGRNRRPEQVLVGFAAETARPGAAGRDLADYARSKLVTKGADLIVANDVAAPGVGFAHDTNAVLIVDSDGTEIDVPLATKDTIAVAIVDAVARKLGRPAAPDPSNQQETT